MFILDWEAECKTIVSSAQIKHSHLIWNLNEKAVLYSPSKIFITLCKASQVFMCQAQSKIVHILYTRHLPIRQCKIHPFITKLKCTSQSMNKNIHIIQDVHYLHNHKKYNTRFVFFFLCDYKT